MKAKGLDLARALMVQVLEDTRPRPGVQGASFGHNESTVVLIPQGWSPPPAFSTGVTCLYVIELETQPTNRELPSELS